MTISGSASAQRSDSIAAVVNGDIITYTDLYDRMDLVIKSARMPNTNEFKSKLLPQVLTGLITEGLQLQEATRLGLNINQDEVDKGFADLAVQNKLQLDQFKSILERQNIRVATLEKQIESQIAWSKVIQAEIRPRVALTDADIENEVARLKTKQGQTEYFLAEIFMPYGDASNEADVRKAATDLSNQLSKDPKSFSVAARQFSQSSTAATGGVIGWITPDQMDEEMALTINNINKGQISPPIKSDDGYTILFLRDQRIINLSGEGQAQEKLRVKNAVFTLPDNQSERKQMRDDVAIFERDVKGCLDIIQRVTKYDGATLQEYDDLTSNIPSDIIGAVTNANIGEVGARVETGNTIIVPMLCGRDGGGNDTALEREVEQRMGTQKLDVLQKRYLRDLVTNAYIERRV